jgi:Cof subfamily protein (haloacid dehalogenase superfamily)
MLPPENRDALEHCINLGVNVVVATGRALSTIPQSVRDIVGIKYLVCANGANIYDNMTVERLHAQFISAEAIESMGDRVENAAVMKEIFCGGEPYTSRSAYDDLERFGVPDSFARYVRETRNPVDDIVDFTRRHIREIENVNFNYANHAIRDFLIERLKRDDGRLYTLTASLPFNIEIGGVGVNKGSAVAHIAAELEIPVEQCMCIGDNSNDVSMIRWAGVGVAVADGVPEALAAADYVTDHSAKFGVARALRRFGL